jgi:hypothetical protein
VKQDSVALRCLLAVAIGVIGCLGFLLVPLEAAGGLDCESPLKGADPKEKATEGFLVNREAQACSDKSGSRVTVTVIVGLLWITVGIGAATLPESFVEKVVFGGEDPEEVFER